MDDTRGVTFSGEGRRAFLRRAAVVGAIAWTAPIALSSADVAGPAGSCAALSIGTPTPPAPVDADDAAPRTPAPEPDAEVRTPA